MAGRRTEPTTPTAPTPKPLAIEPPARTRTRPSTADTATAEGMKALMDEGKYASNSVDYKTKKDAGNAAVIYRRAIIRLYGGNPNAKGDPVAKRIGTQTWGKGENGGEPFVFALHLKPEAATPAA